MYCITYITFILFVMNMIFFRFLNELPIHRVFFFKHGSYGNGLIHFVAYNDTRSFFS